MWKWSRAVELYGLSRANSIARQSNRVAFETHARSVCCTPIKTSVWCWLAGRHRQSYNGYGFSICATRRQPSIGACRQQPSISPSEQQPYVYQSICTIARQYNCCGLCRSPFANGVHELDA